MFNQNSPHYRAAFNLYLRKGIAIETSLEILRKAASNAETAEHHTTNLYIWRTAGDGKVRPSHAANDGKVFYWGNRPPTGHPGEDFGCRCTAVPIQPDNTPLEILALIAALSPIGLARRIGLGVARQALRRVLEDEPPPPKPTEPPPPRSINDRPNNVPKDWETSSTKNDGIQYTDPNNSHNYVRIERGNPTSTNPGQRVDYVRWQKDGKALDKYGNIVSSRSLESHIPLENFEFKLELFK